MITSFPKSAHYVLLLSLSVLLLGCPDSKEVEPNDLTTDLVGHYHGEHPVGFPGDDIAKYVYDVDVTRAKTNEINLKISGHYFFRQSTTEPYKDAGAIEDRYFENGKVTETKRFVIQESRTTNWNGHKSARTEINIEGKLTGSILALVATYKFPAYGDQESLNVNLDKK